MCSFCSIWKYSFWDESYLDLPALQSIVCNRCAFQGDMRHCNESESELVMRSEDEDDDWSLELPSLTMFSLDIDCFSHIDCVTIDRNHKSLKWYLEVPNVQHICIGYDSFYYTQTLYIRSNDGMKMMMHRIGYLETTYFESSSIHSKCKFITFVA